jgi:hypothetical protein
MFIQNSKQVIGETLVKNNYYFLCGLPRAGNTLLASLINQNPKITLTANSIVPEIMYQIASLKKTETYKNFPDWQSLDNVILNVFDNYYKNYKAEHIIDRGPWGTPQNLEYVKGLFDEPKFIVLVRSVIECLTSFLRMENVNVEDLDLRSDELMSGVFGKHILAIENLKDEENVLYLNYNNLVKYPLEALEKIYKFLNVEKYQLHRFTELEQLNINGIKYDDSIMIGQDMHTIKTDRIKPSIYKVENFITQRIVKKYKEQIDYIEQFV